jgi:hypothetical protein
LVTCQPSSTHERRVHDVFRSAEPMRGKRRGHPSPPQWAGSDDVGVVVDFTLAGDGRRA